MHHVKIILVFWIVDFGGMLIPTVWGRSRLDLTSLLDVLQIWCRLAVGIFCLSPFKIYMTINLYSEMPFKNFGKGIVCMDKIFSDETPKKYLFGSVCII